MDENLEIENKNVIEENNKQKSKKGFIDYLAILLRYKVLIICVTGVSVIGSLVVSFLSLKLSPETSFLPNKYTSTAYMLIEESSDGGAADSMMSMLNQKGLGSLAGMVGVSIPSGGESNIGLATYLIHSNSLLDQLNDMFNFTARYKIEENPIANTRKALMKVLSSNVSEDTGVFSVSFTDVDPCFARDVVNYTIRILEKRFMDFHGDQNVLKSMELDENINAAYNVLTDLQNRLMKIEASAENYWYGADAIVKDVDMLKLEFDAQKQIYKQLKAQKELLKIEIASEKPVFRIIDTAEIPDIKSEPSRGMICIIVSFIGFVVSILLAFLCNWIHNLKNNPKVMAKLKRK